MSFTTALPPTVITSHFTANQTKSSSKAFNLIVHVKQHTVPEKHLVETLLFLLLGLEVG